jgi:hypothetical membrane protein
MTDEKSTRQDQLPGINQRNQGLIIAAATLLILSVVEYLVSEAITASAWMTPAYSYAANWISDLGVPDVSTFQGRQINSPLHNLMNMGFIVQGVLFLVASILLLRLFSEASRKIYIPLALIYSFGIALVGTFHGSTAATENGTAAYHFLGAFMAIPGGNAIAIVVGFQWRRLKLPRWFGRTSIALGVIGMVSVFVLFATIGLVPSGIVERASVYTIQIWQLLVGIALLGGLRQNTLSKTKEI